MSGFVITVSYKIDTNNTQQAIEIATEIEKASRETFQLEKAFHGTNGVEYLGTFLSKGIESS